MTDSFQLNCDAQIAITQVGHQQTPVFTVDDFLLNDGDLISCARDISTFRHQDSDYYPGVRRSVPQEYEQLIKRWAVTHFSAQLEQQKNHPEVKNVELSLCALSLTNQPPEKLIPIQRIPHFDTTNTNQWAMVHYLCDEGFGGTGFFRHKRSGFETIVDDNQKSYFRNLADDASEYGVPEAKYLQGDSELFELLHYVEAKKNRLVIYPSNLLHSGIIKCWKALTPDQGRLTANTFCIIS